jgi:hypothetical protein
MILPLETLPPGDPNVEFSRHPEDFATKKFNQGFPWFYFDLRGNSVLRIPTFHFLSPCPLLFPKLYLAKALTKGKDCTTWETLQF